MKKKDYPPLTEGQQRLASENIALVWKVVLGLTRNVDRQEQLFSAGCEGLVIAAATYDPDRGCKFGTHAWWWIRARIRDEFKAMRKRPSTTWIQTDYAYAGDGPEVEAERAELARHVRDAVGNLNPRIARALAVDMDGERTNSIAAEFGCVHQYVRELRIKGRQKLRRALVGHAG